MTTTTTTSFGHSGRDVILILFHNFSLVCVYSYALAHTHTHSLAGLSRNSSRLQRRRRRVSRFPARQMTLTRIFINEPSSTLNSLQTAHTDRIMNAYYKVIHFFEMPSDISLRIVYRRVHGRVCVIIVLNCSRARE